MSTQNPNQFAQTNIKGKLDLMFNTGVLSGKIADAETGTLLPGTALKLADVASKIPSFLEAAATDEIFGFLIYNNKDQNFEAGQRCEVAFSESVMLMEAGAAIVPGAKVEIVATGNKVITYAGTNSKVGICLDKAAADGDLVRVLIKTPELST